MRPGAAAEVVADVGDGVGDADRSGQHADYGDDIGPRSSTVIVGVPPKYATAIAAAIFASNSRQENTSMKPRPETSSAWIVIDWSR